MKKQYLKKRWNVVLMDIITICALILFSAGLAYLFAWTAQNTSPWMIPVEIILICFLLLSIINDNN